MHRILGIAVLVITFGLAWLMMEYNRFSDTPMELPDEGITYTFAPGTSLRHLAEDLEHKDILSSALYLRVMARIGDSAQRLQAGEYLIPRGTTPKGLLALLISGKVTNYSLTVVEGWTFAEMLDAVRRSDALKQTLTSLSPEEVWQRLGVEGDHPEGRFLPDTYHFPKGTTDLAFLRRAHEAMERLLSDEWSKRDQGLPLKTPYEALILASIVEKETGLPEERPEIAGVFTRRLNKGMKLQTDPTVIYGMGDRFDGNIRRKDLREDTPYNTYVHKGLTPTPISLPGADAIRAVLHPADGKTLYFVATGDGGHYFSSTLKEHNRAVAKYQLKRK
jgi:UPF0755 protein